MTDKKPKLRTLPGFKLGGKLTGHTGLINRIAWSPDGKYLASPSDDGSIRIWDAETNTSRQPLEAGVKDRNAHFLNFSVAWSPKGHLLVSALWSSNGKTTVKAQRVLTEDRLWEFDIENDVGELSWSPDGQRIAAACGANSTLIINADNGKLIHEIEGHEHAVTSAAWSPNGQTLATGSFDKTIRLWDAGDWKQRLLLDGHSREVWSVAWSPYGKWMASGSDDKTIRVWDTRTGKQISILEGHTATVKSVSFSFNGRLLASKGADGVRLWRCDTWEMVTFFSEPGGGTFPGLAFHPKAPVLATLGDENKSIRIWNVDFEAVLGEAILDDAPLSQSGRYANARVVLVGDTGVGKSGLALVLTGEAWEKTDSTHGRRVWVLNTQEVRNTDGPKETREILLWDLAGQPDYRLIHQLHLTEVAVALVVFDSRSQTDPFAGVRHWDRALRQAQRVQGDSVPPTKKFLVAARADVGRVGVSAGRIETLKQILNFDEYFETSSKEGWGVAELSAAIHSAIDWGSLPTVSSTALFQDIKSFLVSEKETGRLLSTTDDLYHSFLRSTQTPATTEDLRAQFDTCIGRVESRGLIQRLSFGNLILLQPELQDVYASAMANAVKDEPDGLGCISEDKARAGDFRIPEGERIANKEQEKLLLISTVEELLRHEIALREQGEDGQYLVFPSQLTRENPDLPDPEGKAVIFNFEGPVLNVYATLAVRLSHSGFFRKKEMWKNAATYVAAAVGGTCGMFLREIEEGRGELTLFFDAAASEETRFQFEEFVHTHLRRRGLPESVHRRRIFVCHACGTPIADLAAKRRRERGLDWIACNVCESPPKISIRDREERLPSSRSSKVLDMDRAADAQRERDTAASSLQGKIETGDFDVFLCHNSVDKTAVESIGEQLKARGILPWLDDWELRPGISWQRTLEEQIGQIKSAAVFVGSAGFGPWHQQELEAFLREFVERGCPVIPVVLPDAPKKPALPIFLKGMTWVDFRAASPDPLERLIWGITGERPSAQNFLS
jgi:hypothetical protein